MENQTETTDIVELLPISHFQLKAWGVLNGHRVFVWSVSISDEGTWIRVEAYGSGSLIKVTEADSLVFE